MGDETDDEEVSKPFHMPLGISYPTTLFSDFSFIESECDGRKERPRLSALKSGFFPKQHSKPLDEKYELGIIYTEKIMNTKTEVSVSTSGETTTNENQPLVSLGKSRILSDKECAEFMTMLETIAKQWDSSEEIPDYDRLVEITDRYYITPYIKKLNPDDEKYLLNETYWTPQDLPSGLGQRDAISTTYNDYHGNKSFFEQKRNLFVRWGQEMIGTVNLGKKTFPAVMEVATLMTPAQTFLDMDSEGKWVSIDEASGWGSLGQRKHPKNLTKPEHFNAWNEWTNDFIFRECVSLTGRIYLYASDAKGWDAKRKSWKKTYYGQMYMVDLSRLRPMNYLSEVIRAKQYNSYSDWGGKEYTHSSLEMIPRYSNYSSVTDEITVEKMLLGGGEEAKKIMKHWNEIDKEFVWSWFAKQGIDFEIPDVDESVFNPYRNMFLPTMYVRHPARDVTDDAFGYMPEYSYFHANQRSGLGIIGKMKQPHERARVKIWKPKKSIEMAYFVDNQIQKAKNYQPLINHQWFDL